MRVVPVIPVAKEFVERLAKARAGLVQRRVQVKTRRGTHSRMQWVRPENDRAWGEKEQPGLFDDLPADARKPEPKATPTPKENTKLAQTEDKIDQLKSRIKVTEKVGGTTAMLKKELADKEKEAKGLREQPKPAQAKTNLSLESLQKEVYGLAVQKVKLQKELKAVDDSWYTREEINHGGKFIRQNVKKVVTKEERDAEIIRLNGEIEKLDKQGQEKTRALQEAEKKVENKPSESSSNIEAVDSYDDKGNGKYELNMYTSPMKEKDYPEDKVQVRKETGVTGDGADMKKLRDIWELYEKIDSERKKKYGHPDNERVVLTIDGKRYVVDGYAGDMKKDGDHFYLTPVGGGRIVDYPTNMQGQVDKVDVIKQSEVGEAAKKPFEDMTFEAKENGAEKGQVKAKTSPYTVEPVDSHDDKEHGVRTELFKYSAGGPNAGKYGLRTIDTDADMVFPSIMQFDDEAKARAAFAEAAGIENNRRSDTKPPETKKTYENRKLGYQHARTSADDEYSTEAMAAIALSNMKTGERFPVGRTWYTVSNITDKMLTVTGEDGEKKTFKPSGSKWEALVRDVGRAILGSHHGVDAGDLVTAFMRDPAARREGGMLSIKDTIPPLKKSVVDLFREGLSKAFGTR